MGMAVKQWREDWVVDFYLADESGKPTGEKLATCEIERAYAPTRWARNYAHMLRRQHQGTAVTFSIEKIR